MPKASLPYYSEVLIGVRKCMNVLVTKSLVEVRETEDYSLLFFLGAFFGAFLVLFEARIANCCTFGHILSGNLQMVISSFAFLIAVMLGVWITLSLVLRLRINSIGYR
ncbi:hypothetical protein SULI_11810 [Saccharolobus solfataricus]|uniref:Uncharacterized protein n=2 Tax=Saccharolobus solfataricus TaxID=2287 RepID=Q97Y77_SACS2|nr:YeeE/YedE thiosulfate transporter family protein [Saccharolobus solfataricus]AAK41690.1 Hypothetical protein SSO1462 [Saccharolobus solfataricus P2]AKA74496.1 hypothetical protein SULB_2335 [Saccharolobus solfataricus]AKA77192.1 hypothetical protein SULC_2332 [Saccharolobus solfataricus]AKA79884.1 hypothetical protein SULA_2334 [Saccharolobus solfataricus]AZF68976.1 hypothetical protein SULG_11810 [Saccharolobus solfataricus]